MSNLDKIKIVYNINGLIPVILRVWSIIFITKFVNMNLVMSQLSLSKIMVGGLTIFILQYAKKDSVLDCLKRQINAVYVLYNIVCIGVLLTLLISPFWFIVLEAIQLACIDEFVQLAFQDILNEIYKGRQRTNFTATWKQTKCVAVFIGGLLGLIFNNISLYIALGIIVSSYIIVIPGNMYMFKLIKEELNK